MKKIFGILAAVAVLMTSLVFTSCGPMDDLLGPVDTWCEMPIETTVEDGEKVTLGYMSVIYTEKQVTGSSSTSGELKKGLTIEPGLTLVVWVNPDITSDKLSGTILSGMAGKTYFKKTFSNDNDELLSDNENDKESFTFKATRSKWTAIYYSKYDLRNTNTQHELPKASDPVANSKGYSELDVDLFKDFSWKKLLKTYLINSL